MCAINGITKNDETRVLLMNERTKHRGPDGSSVYVGNGVTLGHNRLAIIDVSSASDQPMKSTDGRYVIVYNGELYNFRELKTEIGDRYDFKTQGDTEVLLAAYILWGDDMFSRLRGIFAFGIWDTHTEALVLARDHMGVKPLYYHFKGGVLSFSSELCGLINEREKVLNRDALALYIEFGYVPSDRSLVDDVKKLRPGHYLVHKGGTLTEHTFYDPLQHVGVPGLPHGGAVYAEADLVQTIDDGVSRQLVSDRPVGVFLSGGIDSSVVLHHMAQHAQSIRTYSVDFEMVSGAESEGNKFNTDAALARMTASRYGAQHTTFTLTIEDVQNALITAIESLDEPIANATAISQYLLSQRVRADGVVVALGGDGGDELFGGYTRHRMAMAAYYFQKLPPFVQRALGYTHPRVAKLSTAFGMPFHTALMATKAKLTEKLFVADMELIKKAEKFLVDTYARVPENYSPVDTFMRIDRATWLPDESLARSDRSGMAHGLELRVPLLDLDIVTYADTIPVSLKTGPFVGKKVLRNAYRSRIPEYLFNQPKRGWISPGAKWLRDPIITQITKEVLSPGYYDGIGGLFNWKGIESMFLDHIEKRGYYLYPLWNILVLQIWARKHNIVLK